MKGQIFCVFFHAESFAFECVWFSEKENGLSYFHSIYSYLMSYLQSVILSFPYLPTCPNILSLSIPLLVSIGTSFVFNFIVYVYFNLKLECEVHIARFWISIFFIIYFTWSTLLRDVRKEKVKKYTFFVSSV